jgi:hypothetical protein
MGLEVPDFGGIRPRARHQAGAGGRADRLLTIRAVERDPRPRDPVEVRALDVTRAIRAELRPQIVDGDEEDVRAVGRVGESGAEEQKAKVEEKFHGMSNPPRERREEKFTRPKVPALPSRLHQRLQPEAQD